MSETARLVSEFDGDGGGGIETELGSRARGVTGPFRGRVGVPTGAPTPWVRPALGVKGPLIVRALDGDVKLAVECGGEESPNAVGLPIDFLLGLAAPVRLLLLVSCLAVIPTYLEAREPGVMKDSGDLTLVGVTLFFVTVTVLVLV